MRTTILFLALCFFLVISTFAQVSINNDGSSPDGSAMLDVKSATKGLLAPRVALLSIITADPVSNPAVGLLVFNTAAAGTAPNNVLPGYYCWSGAKWIQVMAHQGSNIGDMQYWNGSQWVLVPVGVNGQVLTLSNGIPTWGGNQLPMVSTTPVSGITSGSAISGGYVSADGSTMVTARGVCWDSSPNPTTVNSKTINGSGAGNFTSNITGLLPGIVYYLRAYATNSLGTSYGNELSFTTECLFFPAISISIAPTVNSMCAGTTVTFTATPVNYGMASTYQWKVNGINAGTNSTTFTYIPQNNDVVTCVLAVSSLCATGNPATSNAVTMTVNPIVTPTVSIAASGNPVCTGSLVTYTATPANGGSAPAYQWRVNGTNVGGATNATYAYIPSNGDAVSCQMISNAPCITGNPALSNTVTMTVTPLSPVSITIAASANPVNSGTSVTFTATPVNGGASPVYQWVVNGLQVGGNQPVLTYTPADNDSVKCVLTSSQVCVSGNPDTSDVIVMVVNTMNIPCPGIPTVTYEGKTYNTVQIGSQCWFKENLNIGVQLMSNYPSSGQDPTNNGIIEKYCYFNDSGSCDEYGGLYQWNEMMKYVDQQGVQGICPTGWHIPSNNEWNILLNVLGGEATSGGKLREAGTIHWAWPNSDGTNESGYTALPGGSCIGGYFNFVNYNGRFWTSSEADLQNSVARVISTGLPVYNSPESKVNYNSVRCLKDTCSTYSTTGVSISPSANPVCSSTSVTFTATPTNGGTTPYYQWKVNGIPAGTNNPTYIYVPANNDAVTCLMTSSTPCASNPAISNAITMTVNALPAPLTAGTHIASTNQIQWIWNPVAGATGYKWSTSNNYAGATDLGTSTTTTETALTCNTSYTRYVWSYDGCGNSNSVALTQSTSACLPGCGTLTINHTAGVVAPVTKTVTYGTVTNIPGEPTKCWITSNLGADHQATAVDDATEASAGWYWQFNRKQGYKHDGIARTPNSTWIFQIYENSDWQSANDPCNLELGAQWRLPSYTEWSNLDIIGGWGTWNEPWGSGLKLHATGALNRNEGSLVARGSEGSYWSSTQYDFSAGYVEFFYSGSSYIIYSYKDAGVGVRCIKDCASAPSSPSSGTHTPTQTQIIWNWNTVEGATGYKWSATNDYGTATDMGTAPTKTEAGLTCNTSYTHYAWAYNTCGNSTPLTMTQMTLACPWACGQPITDARDNKVYGTVLIGTQCWMQQNLDIGTMISELNVGNQTNNGTIEKYCFNDSESYCDTYGGFYQWDELMNYTSSSNSNPSNRQGICPAGWHVPSNAEFTQLTTFLGEDGGAMKEQGWVHWLAPNLYATNTSGFTAYGAGYYSGDPSWGFRASGADAGFWSATENLSTNGYSIGLAHIWAVISHSDNSPKQGGYSVRCVHD